jgi:hypothetical protein
VPVVETTTTRGAVSVFRSYYETMVTNHGLNTTHVSDLTYQCGKAISLVSSALYFLSVFLLAKL